MLKYRKIYSFVFILCFVGLSLFFSTSASYKDEAVKKEKTSDSFYGLIENSKAKDQKSVKYLDDEIALVYKNTQNLKDSLPDKRSDVFGTYDVYVDQSKTEYLFLQNTDILCGMKQENIGNPVEKDSAISENDAIIQAKSYVTSILGNIDSYLFDECIYDRLAGVYDIRFYKTLSDYKTDDEIRVWVKADGNIGAFSAFNKSRYDKFKDQELILSETKNIINKKISKIIKNANYQLENSYISVNDDGKLILVYDITYDVFVGQTKFPERNIITEEIN